MRRLLLTIAVVGYAFLLSCLPAVHAEEQVGCAVKAKILSVDKRVIQESSARTKVLNSAYLQLEIKNPRIRGVVSAANKKCAEFQKGKEFEVFAIKETDFVSPETFEELTENTALEGEISTSGRGRHKQYAITNVRVMGVYQKVKVEK